MTGHDFRVFPIELLPRLRRLSKPQGAAHQLAVIDQRPVRFGQGPEVEPSTVTVRLIEIGIAPGGSIPHGKLRAIVLPNRITTPSHEQLLQLSEGDAVTRRIRNKRQRRLSSVRRLNRRGGSRPKREPAKAQTHGKTQGQPKRNILAGPGHFTSNVPHQRGDRHRVGVDV